MSASPSPAPDPDFERGVALLREGSWFAAHEALEAAWRRAAPAERDFFQGLVHVAVAWYQAGRGNPVGTERQLAKALRRLAPYAPSHGGVDVSGLLHSVDAARGRFPDLPAPQVADALPGGADLGRALAFLDEIQAGSAVETHPFRFGTVCSDPDHPALWDLNASRLERPGEPDEVAAAVERAHAGAGHRHRKLFVRDERTATRLTPRLRELGWTVERYLVMALVARPSPGPHAVEEIGEDEIVAARRAFVHEAGLSGAEEVAAQIGGFALARRRAAEVTVFGHRKDGGLVAWCDLYSRGDTGQVEDVVTLGPHRRRGYASSVVAHATRASVASGHTLTFLVVDEVGGPVALYERLGYAALGREHAFFRPPPP